MFTFKKVASFCCSKRMLSANGNFRIILEHLKERSLIRVAGEDVEALLQGLITNDIHHLGQYSGGSMYTMFLNTRGRVLYDTMIYRAEENNTYYVECDKFAVEPIQRHLKMYRVKRKVEISSLGEKYAIHSLFKFRRLSLDSNSKLNRIEGVIMPCDKLKGTLPETSSTLKIYKDLIIFKDPRVVELGSRIISKVGTNVKDQICEVIGNVDTPTEDMNYKIFRYSLGVGEGFNDLPVANCFPLECNCDYLHGISFHKGCYIGQELTARTHHTGVIRKRLMPLYFNQIPTKLPTDNVILYKNVNLGRLRGIEGNVGLALLRISKALDFGEFSVGNGIAKVIKPSWWPLEAPKEKVNVEKN
ncbi:putative transferase CAF17 homolog, mitochondrial isoform X1 [Anoplophora glabripennis]|nr:putative transferase CAF17 homolog, mitochondrial isoform X1 [Anoplophora glabripennis]